MGTNLDLVQGAVVLALTVILALIDRTCNGLIGSTSAFHDHNLLQIDEGSICTFSSNMQKKCCEKSQHFPDTKNYSCQL
jgi:hypothetical protein